MPTPEHVSGEFVSGGEIPDTGLDLSAPMHTQTFLVKDGLRYDCVYMSCVSKNKETATNALLGELKKVFGSATIKVMAFLVKPSVLLLPAMDISHLDGEVKSVPDHYAAYCFFFARYCGRALTKQDLMRLGVKHTTWEGSVGTYLDPPEPPEPLPPPEEDEPVNTEDINDLRELVGEIEEELVKDLDLSAEYAALPKKELIQHLRAIEKAVGADILAKQKAMGEKAVADYGQRTLELITDEHLPAAISTEKEFEEADGWWEGFEKDNTKVPTPQEILGARYPELGKAMKESGVGLLDSAGRELQEMRKYFGAGSGTYVVTVDFQLARTQAMKLTDEAIVKVTKALNAKPRKARKPTKKAKKVNSKKKR